MQEKAHHYHATVTWTGNAGSGTSGYTAYSRDHTVGVPGKPEILASADPAFRGDPARHNPEDLLVASLSGCHMLCYLSLCAKHGIVVVSYMDSAEGTMQQRRDGSGYFSEVVLRPRVTLAPGSDIGQADALHEDAHHRCFIANSVNFEVRVEATCAEAE